MPTHKTITKTDSSLTRSSEGREQRFGPDVRRKQEKKPDAGAALNKVFKVGTQPQVDKLVASARGPPARGVSREPGRAEGAVQRARQRPGGLRLGHEGQPRGDGRRAELPQPHGRPHVQRRQRPRPEAGRR